MFPACDWALRVNWLIHFILTLKITTEDWQINETFQSDVVPEANSELSASDNPSICVSTTEKMSISVLGKKIWEILMSPLCNAWA